VASVSPRFKFFAFTRARIGLDRPVRLWYALGNKGVDGNEYAPPGGQRAWGGVSQVRTRGGKSFLSRRLNADASKPRRSGPRYHDLAMLVATECLAMDGARKKGGTARASLPSLCLKGGSFCCYDRR
jgi:hypothetical protein